MLVCQVQWEQICYTCFVCRWYFADKLFLSCNFEIKDFDEIYFVLDIQICRDRSKDILELSQETYIENVLIRYDI